MRREGIGASLALAGGLVGYSGVWWLLPCAMLSMLGWGMAPSRRAAFRIMLVYYLAASRGLFHGGGVFFAGSTSPTAFSWEWGLFVWALPSLLLASAWAACWGRRHLNWRVIAALVLVSVPPVGFLGWANPAAGLGVWLPGQGWAGIIIGLFAAGLLVGIGQALAESIPGRLARARRRGLGLAGCALMSGATLVYQGGSPSPVAPAGWVGVNMALGEVDGYQAMRAVQDATVKSVQAGARLVLLPEAVGGAWELNRLYWAAMSDELQAEGAAALIGADLRIDQVRRVNGLFGVGRLQGLQFSQRVPVPLGMWAPWSTTRHIVADWNGKGVTEVNGHRAMILICYEQFLIWPALVSAAQNPDVVLAAANLWWASGTSIPAIQEATVRSFARLFSLPVVQARNLAP